jgi:hypothetical protein
MWAGPFPLSIEALEAPVAPDGNPTKGVYQVSCISPCGAITYFRIEDTRPFAVPDDLYRRGNAEPGECEPSQIA